MLRRWAILLGMLTLVAGMAVATGSASAATMGFRPGGPIHLVGSAATDLNARGGIRHQAESTNWSGYAATTGTYTSVSASWTEPTGTCSGTAKYSSFWVGLDGYSSSSVEQTGSEVDCSGSRAGVTQIIMIDSAGRDKETVSSLSGGESFSATWLRSN